MHPEHVDVYALYIRAWKDNSEPSPCALAQAEKRPQLINTVRPVAADGSIVNQS